MPTSWPPSVPTSPLPTYTPLPALSIDADEMVAQTHSYMIAFEEHGAAIRSQNTTAMESAYWHILNERKVCLPQTRWPLLNNEGCAKLRCQTVEEIIKRRATTIDE